MSRSRLSAIAIVAVGCSVLLAEEPEQCTRDADCADLGFSAATCDASGVCVASAQAGSGGAGGGGDGGAAGGGGEGGAGDTPAAGQGGGGVPAAGGAGNGGEAGMVGLGGGGAGGSPPAAPSGLRPIGSTLTQTAGGSAPRKYVDTCPEDQVLIGVNGWTNVSPTWLMRGQAVCGKLVLDETLSIRVDAGAVLDQRGAGLVDDVEASALCGPSEVVVGFDGRAGVYMDQIRVYCAPLSLTGGPGSYSLELGDAEPRGSVGAATGGGAFGLLACPPGQLARGGHLQAGEYLDAFGLVCARPELVHPVGAGCEDDADCDTARCESGACAASTCVASADCTCASFDTRSYQFCAGTLGWTDARSSCAATDMDLARVDDGAENGWLRSTATLRALASFWISASDGATEGDWLWPDGALFWQGTWNAGTAVDGLYNAWDPAQPDNALPGEHCGEIFSSSLWNDAECAAPKNFVCEAP